MKITYRYSVKLKSKATSVSNSQRRWQRRCQEADNISSERAVFIFRVSER